MLEVEEPLQFLLCTHLLVHGFLELSITVRIGVLFHDERIEVALLTAVGRGPGIVQHLLKLSEVGDLVVLVTVEPPGLLASGIGKAALVVVRKFVWASPDLSLLLRSLN